MVQNNLAGKTIIVTGANGALGQAAVRAITDAGGRLILFGRTFSDVLKEAHNCYEIDLTDTAAVIAVVSRVGDFDAVFNIAGGFDMGAATASDDNSQWERMQALNVETVRNMIKASIPVMTARGSGAMVNIGAYSALGGVANMSAYVASKAMVMNLTQSLAEEVKAHGINVNAVLPTIIDSPANRAAMPDADPADWVCPERLAQVMIFLASEDAKDIHGALIPVRGRR